MSVGGEAQPATPWNSVSPPAACAAFGGGAPIENPSCPGPGSGSIGTCGVYVSGEPNPGLSGGVSPSMESPVVACRTGRFDVFPMSERTVWTWRSKQTHGTARTTCTRGHASTSKPSPDAPRVARMPTMPPAHHDQGEIDPLGWGKEGRRGGGEKGSPFWMGRTRWEQVPATVMERCAANDAFERGFYSATER